MLSILLTTLVALSPNNETKSPYAPKWQPFNHTGVARLKEQDDSKFQIDFVQLEKADRERPKDNRAREGYDCLETEPCSGKSKSTNVDPNTWNEALWPDWRDSTSYFLPGRKWYVVNDDRSLAYQKFIEDHKLKDWWFKKYGKPNRHIMQPVLAYTGGSVFILNSDQKRFWRTRDRVCPECVEFKKVSEVPSIMKETIQMKLNFMKDQKQIPDWTKYDTVLFFKDTGKQKAMRELSDIIDDETFQLMEDMKSMKFSSAEIQSMLDKTVLQGPSGALDWFVDKWLLSPDQLTYGKLVGPSPDPSDYKVKPVTPNIPVWVRMRYAPAGEKWILAGWEHIKKNCPDCETWADWFCGSNNACRKQLHEPESETSGLTENKFLIGDRSILDMTYSSELHFKVSEAERTHVYGIDPPGASPQDLYWENRKWHYQNTIDANKKADEFLGIKQEYYDADMLVRREMAFVSEWMPAPSPTPERSSQDGESGVCIREEAKGDKSIP